MGNTPIGNVALVCPARIVTVAGTVVAAVLALVRLTVRSLLGAEETDTVPVEAMEPAFSATGFGVSAKDKSGLPPDSGTTVPETEKSLPV